MRIRLALGCLAPVLLVALIGWKWPTVHAGVTTMAGADGEWLVVAGVAAALTWLAASGCQVGSTLVRLPWGRVFAVQVAGSFVNHVLPAGLGTAGLNLRMLSRCGLSRERAAGAVALNLGVGIVLHVVTLGVLVGLRFGGGTSAAAVAVLVGAVVAALAGTAVVRWHPGVRRRLADWLGHCREVLRSPSRASLLWLGSAAIPALHIVCLLAVLHSLGARASVAVVALAYLSASAVSALLPTPGGFGGLDVALAAALVADGLPARIAVSAVIGYRLVTVWIPLLPGAGSFLVLLHRRLV